MAEKKSVEKKPAAKAGGIKKATSKPAPAKKAAAKVTEKSGDEAAFGKALSKLGKLKFANKDELLALYKAGIARGRALAKKR